MNRRPLFFDPDPPNPPAGGGAPPAGAPPTPPAAPAPTPPASPPTLIFGKYNSIADAEKAYNEAQAKITAQGNEIASLKNPKPPATPPAADGLNIPTTPAMPAPPAAPTTPTGQIDIKAILTEAKLEAPALVKQWTDKGALTDDQYKVFETKGISRTTVDDYMRGQQAIHALAVQTQREIRNGAIEKLGGGQIGTQRVNTLLTFAGTLDKAVQEDIQRRLHDPHLYHGAIDQLASEYNRKHNLAGSKAIVVGSGPRVADGFGGGAKPFSTKVEMVMAMKQARQKMGGLPNAENSDPEYVARLNATDMSKLK